MSSSYDNYNNNNEDILKLKDIYNIIYIAILKIKKYYDCKFLVDNEELRANSKKEMIKLFLEQKEKINELQKEINFLVKKDEWDNCNNTYGNFYDIAINLNSILKLKNWLENSIH
jgi:hypothetical protein